MNISLYQVSEEYIRACDELIGMGDELPPEAVKDTLDGIIGTVEEKSLNVASYYKNICHEVQAMKEYESSMRERRRSLENKANRLKEYLKENLEKCGIKKVTGVEFTVRIQAKPASVVIDDPDLIDKRFVRNVDINYDKGAIKQSLNNGESVNGVHLERGTTLIIK